jgi:hypothetical protein
MCASHLEFSDLVVCRSLSGNSRSSVPVQQPAVAPVEAPEMEEGFWSCSVCTFDNPLESLTCDICDTPREEASEEVSGTSSKEKGIVSHCIIPYVSVLILAAVWHFFFVKKEKKEKKC